jgi:hypothetical protein
MDPRQMWCLMFVCRKLYAETRLLPFQLNNFYVSYWVPVAYFIDGLSKLLTVTQMNAISTIIVGDNTISNWKTDGLFMLGKLKGLKRMIISNRARWVYAGFHENLSSFFQHCEAGNMEVVLDPRV